VPSPFVDDVEPDFNRVPLRKPEEEVFTYVFGETLLK
jgi:hypothetical protein